MASAFFGVSNVVKERRRHLKNLMTDGTFPHQFGVDVETFCLSPGFSKAPALYVQMTSKAPA
jgi:hypothetical protein